VPNLRLIGPEEIREIEPHAAGIRALHVPGSGIIDYKQVCEKLAAMVAESGGELRTKTRVVRMSDAPGEAVLETTNGTFRARHVIGCAGLHSDRLARLHGAEPGARIVPFRGEYYELVPERRNLVRALIYPVPDARFPFLGVHFTRMIDGSVEAGPNAVLALAREGYRKSRVNLRDLAETLAYPGFWRLATRHWRMGWDEMVRSFSKKAFAHALARLVPELREQDIVPAGAGVRAQALQRNGDLVDDFLVVAKGRALHVCNAPSPAATACLAIADEIIRRAATEFDLRVRP
jgi:L-2-hydroxyglutarate oxidase